MRGKMNQTQTKLAKEEERYIIRVAKACLFLTLVSIVSHYYLNPLGWKGFETTLTGRGIFLIGIGIWGWCWALLQKQPLPYTKLVVWPFLSTLIFSVTPFLYFVYFRHR